MLRLGLTGSIATGKSTVLDAFRELGVPVISADDAVHALYRGPAVGAVEALFPGVAPDGEVDRQLLSQQLTAYPELIPKLEAVVHPMVRQAIASFFADAEAAGEALAVAEIPLLYESGHDYGLDAVAVTTVDRGTQEARALARAGMTVEKLQAILARQLPQADKVARADYVFDTAKPQAETVGEVAALVNSLRSRLPQ